MANGDSGIDARYAAQFQRGYNGPVLAPPTTPTPSTHTHSMGTSPVRISSGPTAAAARIPDPPSALQRREPTEQPADADEPAVSESDEIVERHGALFEWALLGSGVVLLALAVAAFWSAANDISAYSSPYPSDLVVLIDVRNRLPGPLLVSSVVALSGWLAVRALRPRSRAQIGKDGAP